MSELISRQAAIDVVRKWFDKIQLNGDICLDGIISLPSITSQLETSEDAISREAIYEALSEWDEQDVYLPYHFKELVAELPSVMPKVEPFSDAISRAEVLKYAQLVRDDEGIVHEMVHVDDIKGVSSVTWSGWKSVTWELPEPNTAVLLYVKYKSSGQRTYQLGMWNDSKQTWEDWRTPYQLEEEFEVIAWMELPEGYEEDNDEW